MCPRQGIPGMYRSTFTLLVPHHVRERRRPLLRKDPEAFCLGGHRQSREFGEGTGSQILHSARPVVLHRTLAEAEVVRRSAR